ncbi:hypothetical protein FHS19_000305 [Paenibacillus rhizosphaerae]|uniref:Uncharacterized protein n=1 Tax=Paenibacillus rhizosphaerae TaxID=297318 RepID=A0A839TG18_9BACL|nr:hypothetical protein [Paenibacillus rhizosphaerae]
MKHCALYSSTFDLDQIVDLMKAIDPNGKMSVNETKTRIEIVSKGWLRRKATAFNIMTSKTHRVSLQTCAAVWSNFLPRSRRRTSRCSKSC